MPESKSNPPLAGPVFLPRIKSPADLKRLSLDELTRLAAEIRQEIIKTVMVTGGHLAPSLGVVELTLALHYAFEAPQDKIIWDVGHQSYAHKIVTGRYDRFNTLRQHGGLSGFPKRSESVYDCLDTGHASTSLSAALGMSVAKDLKCCENRVIAVIGDGSMTGGMAFEALNQAGSLGKDLIVVLNDNAMSISPNVGALSEFLSRKLTGRFYVHFKNRFINAFKDLPQGDNVIHWARRWEEAVKSFFTPGMLFEALKFDYLGPINGHRLERLIETFTNLSHLRGPVLVHVLTTKGKGYEPAEKNPTYFHGVGALVRTGRPAKEGAAEKTAPTYTEVFGQTICRLARQNERLVAITAAMPEGTGLHQFALEFPDRTFDVGIAEQHAVTFAAGLSLEGFVPVVAIYSTFLQRAFDQIIHDVCLQDLHVVLALDRGGVVGEDGPTHHGAFDLSFLRLIPNLTLMAPRDENLLQHMLATAVEAAGPVALRYPRGRGRGVDLDPDLKTLPLGRGEVLRPGRDLLILAAGHTAHPALEAAERLSAWGISAAVVDPRFIKPLDKELILDLSATCRKVVTVEENAAAGGFGSAVLECLAEAGLSLPVKIVGLPDRFIDHGSQTVLRRLLGLDAEGLTQTIGAWMKSFGPRLVKVEAR